jgi:hypothetical protein
MGKLLRSWGNVLGMERWIQDKVSPQNYLMILRKHNTHLELTKYHRPIRTWLGLHRSRTLGSRECPNLKAAVTKAEGMVTSTLGS